MRAILIHLSEPMLTVAVAMMFLVLLVYELVSWEIAVLALIAVLAVCWMRSGGQRRSTEPRATSQAGSVALLRLLRVRISVRAMMIMVACVAILLWPVHCCLQMPYYDERALFHGLM